MTERGKLQRAGEGTAAAIDNNAIKMKNYIKLAQFGDKCDPVANTETRMRSDVYAERATMTVSSCERTEEEEEEEEERGRRHTSRAVVCT